MNAHQIIQSLINEATAAQIKPVKNGDGSYLWWTWHSVDDLVEAVSDYGDLEDELWEMTNLNNRRTQVRLIAEGMGCKWFTKFFEVSYDGSRIPRQCPVEYILVTSQAVKEARRNR